MQEGFRLIDQKYGMRSAGGGEERPNKAANAVTGLIEARKSIQGT
jgi:hypothetical protein